ncbi:zonular occludens toxin family protein [Oceanobacter mangrovi]|uniref:zonular occludens toxin family protein n=1 Tax=Oceanobacter mangrovi TaxID=2862510 RepID=UPI001C8EC753|nr:zonular occludens toxin domain-containing protein [Oceanobacter mangrovi]
MTAVIHHGPPGSYKTFALIQRVIIPALQQGRVVCHNIRGLDSIPRITEAMDIEVPESAQLICIKHDSQEGFEYMAKFFQWAPVGALIVMDEGQRVYPTRLRSLAEFDTPEDQRETLESGVQRPSNVENAFDQHRHMNWDIYISTTNVAKIHKEVRAVVEYAFRHRDMTGVLPWYKNKWREFKHDAEASGKSVSHYIGTPQLYKSDARVFQCYQSTATGKAKGSNENKSVFNDPKLRVFIGIVVLAICYLVYNVPKVADRFLVPPEATGPNPVAAGAVPGQLPDHRAGDQVGSESSLDVPLSQPEATSPKGPDSRFYPSNLADFFALTNPDFRGASLYEYRRSKDWRLSGVIAGGRSVALITDGQHTLKLSLKHYCAYLNDIDEWICLFDGAMVGRFTGRIEQDDEQPLEQSQELATNSQSDAQSGNSTKPQPIETTPLTNISKAVM